MVSLNDWVPKYIKRTVAEVPGFIITAENWNTLWTLNITQGDHNSETLYQLIPDYLLYKDTSNTAIKNCYTKAETDTAIKNCYTKAETDTAIGQKIVELGAGDMTKAVYDPLLKQKAVAFADEVEETYQPNADPSLQTSNKTVAGAINEVNESVAALKNGTTAAGDAAKLGGKAAAEYLTNKNELDNSDFLNPVNQRGVSGTVSALGYFLDRWKLVSGTVQITAAGIILNGTIVQILERAIGASFTASASAGTASYNDATRTFVLTATGQTITWAKLEKGTTKTPYVPKGYGAELAESRRYYYIFPFHYSAVHVQAAPYPTVVPVQFPVTMRISPTITHAKYWDSGVTSISFANASTGGCGISINAASGALIDAHYLVYASADL